MSTGSMSNEPMEIRGKAPRLKDFATQAVLAYASVWLPFAFILGSSQLETGELDVLAFVTNPPVQGYAVILALLYAVICQFVTRWRPFLFFAVIITVNAALQLSYQLSVGTKPVSPTFFYSFFYLGLPLSIAAVLWIMASLFGQLVKLSNGRASA